MRKCKTLERDVSPRETELAKARQSAETARNEAQGALQEIQEARKIAAGKALCAKQIREEEVSFTNPDSEFSRSLC